MKKEFIHSLELLRVCASVLVAASHIPLTNQLFGNNIGGFSVLIFFMLSGFLLVYNEKPSQQYAFLKRWLRIAPMYYVFTVFTFTVALVKPSFFNTTQATWGNLVKSLLFIPYTNPNGVVRPILDIGWALVPEICFFFLYYFCGKLLFKYRFAALVTLSIVGSVLARILWEDNPIVMQYWTAGLYMAIGVIIALFGKIVGWKTLYTVRKQVVMTVSLIIFFGISAILFGGRYLSLNDVLRDTIPVVCFILFVWGNRYVATNKLITELSKSSFSLYLSHQFVVKGVDRLLYPLNQLDVITVGIALICLVIAVVVSQQIYYRLERPMTRFLLSKVRV